jgi:hypothetical protein
MLPVDQFTPITKEGDRAIGADPVSSFLAPSEDNAG